MLDITNFLDKKPVLIPEDINCRDCIYSTEEKDPDGTFASYRCSIGQFFMDCDKFQMKETKMDSKMPDVKPACEVAWNRIMELASAIKRQHESGMDEKLVEKWANEITWQCSIIETMKEEKLVRPVRISSSKDHDGLLKVGTCPECGQVHLNNRDNKFCGGCGRRLNWDDA